MDAVQESLQGKETELQEAREHRQQVEDLISNTDELIRTKRQGDRDDHR
jgi:hypothetical protein